MGLDLHRFERLAQNAKRTVAERRGARTARSGVVAEPQEKRPRFQLLAQWRDRIQEARRLGSFSDRAGQYAAGQTTRDYICNTIGQTAAGSFFFLISVVATHFAGTEQAGMFSLSVTIGLLLMYVGNYGVRAYQVSDVEEMQSFNDYQIQRLITCGGMFLIGFLYCMLRGYQGTMLAICLGVILFRVFDALADVYEGRLQQKDKLYLAGISQTLRHVAAFIVCTLVLVITRNLIWACWSMAIAEAAVMLIVTLPLTFFETERSYPATKRAVKELFVQCLPVFLALFLYNVLESMPKFAMEGVLAYENQLYYLALNATSQMVLVISGLIFNPQIVRLAKIWAEPTQRKRFDLTVLAMFGIIVVVAGLVALCMSLFGIRIFSIMYGLDFEQYRPLVLVMCAEGGLCATANLFYQIITLLREQQSITKLYLIALVSRRCGAREPRHHGDPRGAARVRVPLHPQTPRGEDLVRTRPRFPEAVLRH